jgi:virulence-associated protein VagC
MTIHAKLFQNGGSQAVRLPKECRFPEGQLEVVARRDGTKVILEAIDQWPQDFAQLIGSWTEPIERLRQGSLQKLKDPFR